jgi:hypothetical protein
MTQITRWTPHVKNLKFDEMFLPFDQGYDAHTFNYNIYKFDIIIL